MANADAAFGLRPVRYRSGKAYTGGGQEAYAFDTSAALAIGDPVVMSGAGEAATGLPVFKLSAAAGPIDGVIVGMLSDAGSTVLTRDNARVIPASASTGAFVLVETDPDVIYEIQEDSGGGAIAADSVGLHANLAIAAPDAVNGLSKVELDSSTAAADATGGLALKIVSLQRAEDNALGANAIWEVVINKTAWRGAGTSR